MFDAGGIRIGYVLRSASMLVIAGHSEQFTFPRNPVITTEFGLNVPELVDIVFRVRSGGGDLSHSVRVRLLI